LKKARDTYASYALAYLNSAGQVTAANLDSLGICFASNIPASRLATLSVADFISRINYFIGLQTQLDSASAAAVASLINKAVGTYTLENLLLNILQDAAIYSSNLTGISTVSNVIFVIYIFSILKLREFFKEFTPIERQYIAKKNTHR